MLYVAAVVDNINSGVIDIEDGLKKAKRMMKDAASHQLETVADSTVRLNNSLRKSVKSYSKEVHRFTRSVGEIIDIEDILKSAHKVVHPDEHAYRKSSIVHTPIDWSKYPPSAFRRGSSCCYQFALRDEMNDNEDIDEEMEGKKIEPNRKPIKVQRSLERCRQNIHLGENQKPIHAFTNFDDFSDSSQRSSPSTCASSDSSDDITIIPKCSHLKINHPDKLERRGSGPAYVGRKMNDQHFEQHIKTIQNSKRMSR